MIRTALAVAALGLHVLGARSGRARAPRFAPSIEEYTPIVPPSVLAYTTYTRAGVFLHIARTARPRVASLHTCGVAGTKAPPASWRYTFPLRTTASSTFPTES